MLTIDEIAAKMRVHRNTIRRLIKKGEITAIKVGDQYRVEDSAFNRFISGATISILKPDNL